MSADEAPRIRTLNFSGPRRVWLDCRLPPPVPPLRCAADHRTRTAGVAPAIPLLQAGSRVWPGGPTGARKLRRGRSHDPGRRMPPNTLVTCGRSLRGKSGPKKGGPARRITASLSSVGTDPTPPEPPELFSPEKCTRRAEPHGAKAFALPHVSPLMGALVILHQSPDARAGSPPIPHEPQVKRLYEIPGVATIVESTYFGGKCGEPGPRGRVRERETGPHAPNAKGSPGISSGSISSSALGLPRPGRCVYNAPSV